MFMILTCHTEVDRANQYGNAKENPVEKQSFNHIPVLLSFLAKYEIPITFSLMVGGQAGTRLLKFISEGVKFPLKSELSVHFHFEEYNESERIWESGEITERKIVDSYKAFYEILGFRPISAVFGHWVIDEGALKLMKEIGVKVDGSYAPYRHNENFILKNPFRWEDILEVPVVSNGKYPLNPFRSPYHLVLLKQIIKHYHAKEIVLHIGFHSYDFFNFNSDKVNIRSESLRIFEEILLFANNYDLKFMNLSDTLNYDFDPCTISYIPLNARLKRYIFLVRDRIMRNK